VLTPAEQKSIGNHLFGCDVCQTICPWNSKLVSCPPESCSLSQEELISLVAIGDEEFRNRYRNSALLRTKRTGLVRNACAVLGNIRSQKSLDRLKAICESDPDPVLRITAGRALLEIDPVAGRQSIRQFAASETDPQVKAEFETLLK
jgi:epoxyqueuosine reductase